MYENLALFIFILCIMVVVVFILVIMGLFIGEAFIQKNPNAQATLIFMSLALFFGALIWSGQVVFGNG